jgi:hypothetical protein
MNSHHFEADNSNDPRLWAIVLFLPNAQHRIISRFRNRQDADDQLRMIRRFVPQQTFELVFLPPPIDQMPHD